jgi:hypothetical protein
MPTADQDTVCFFAVREAELTRSGMFIADMARQFPHIPVKARCRAGELRRHKCINRSTYWSDFQLLVCLPSALDAWRDSVRRADRRACMMHAQPCHSLSGCSDMATYSAHSFLLTQRLLSIHAEDDDTSLHV